MKTTTTKIKVGVPPLNIGTIRIDIVGKTPLLMDRFPEEAKKEILAKQSGLSKGNKKKIRDITEEANEAIHWTSDDRIGYPAYGFKKGMVESTSFIGDKMFSKKLVSGIRIMNVVDGLIPIEFEKQDILEHSIGSNTKFSPRFFDWKCQLVINYDMNNISASDLVTLINYAGFYNGVGAWRPKGGGGGSGEYGMYEVQT